MALALLGLTAVAAAASADPRGVSAGDAFATLKMLVGTWTGTTDAGRPMMVRFATAANGTTVVETQSPAERDEMVTVYYVVGDDLVLTHYCPMGPHGNQPHMTLDRARSSPGDLVFAFTSLTNLDPAENLFVHDGRIVVRDRNHIERDWTIFHHGHAQRTQRFRLTRQGDAGADVRPPAARPSGSSP